MKKSRKRDDGSRHQPNDVSYVDAPQAARSILERGLAYLETKGITPETAFQFGIQFGSVDRELIFERLGVVDAKWANACVAIWFPCMDSKGNVIGWQAEAVPGD
jgi:hypothetical protein